MKHLIIGTGSAALSALESMRSINQDDEVKLVTREALMPYSPTALPFLLSDRIQEAGLWLKDGSFFEKMKSSLALNKEVIEVLPSKKQVFYKDGTKDVYDRLLITSGSSPVVRDIKGFKESGFLTFHTFYDYKAIKKSLDEAGLKKKGNIVIYGGGLVAAELAIPLIEAGYSVDMVIRSRILRSYINPRMGERIVDLLTEKGAKIHQGCVVEEVKGNGSGAEVVLSDGRILHSDIKLILALGVKPEISFLKGTGIQIDDGVVVDKKMQTNVVDIYAAGDAAEAPEFFSGKRGLSGILPSAVRQGKVAGANMVGEDVEYSGWIPMNLFNFFGHVIFSIGLSKEDQVETIEHIDQKKGAYKELYFRENKLVGACFLDVPVDAGVFLYLIENRVQIGPYKDVLLEKPRETGRWLMMEAERALTKL